MRCPQCQCDNPDEAKFCNTCGGKLGRVCVSCGQANPPDSRFCNHCGSPLATLNKVDSDTEAMQPIRPAATVDASHENACAGPESERKCVTVLFSDLSGYTEMSEKLDPEDVKGITSAIFGRFADIVRKYDGFIEKYIGDAILAVFGAVESFEDSALRAIRAAREIHAHVASVSPRYESLIGRTLTMHTGINTGVVVTGEINFEKGTHGLVGDTINTAARLMSISPAGEIVVDKYSFAQTEGYFAFETLAPVTVKGKAKPIPVYRVVKALSAPRKLHRLHGLRAELIGRSIEMQILEDAVEKLEQGQRAVVAVCGTAGTGKSRLVGEFKTKLDLKRIRWFDANAYPYTQNTSYYPLIDLLTRAFQIEEGDRPETIQRKVENSLKGVLGLDAKVVPYIGSLFSIETDETRDVSPEFWKGRLFQVVRDVIEALTASGPTVICVEDMHWADPSFLELLRHLIADMPGSVLFICIYRPLISLFTNLEIQSLDVSIKELRLKELSPSETQIMVGSLLQSDAVPRELKRFVHEGVEGNPFYVEEVINSLIDSGVLSRTNSGWEITRAISESDISTNIQGVLAGRIDRLGNDAKRILQEASVIGRAFLYDILRRISAIGDDIDKNLLVLERLDLISARSIQPTLEYIFKHALTQEIVYNGLVKAERQSIHEKIAQVIETLFKDRLSEFYESLAFHYSRGTSTLKAAEFLVKAGEKSLKRYSLEESHKNFKVAYEMLREKENKSKAENEILIDLMIKWSLVFYYRGAFKDLEELLTLQEKISNLIEDKRLEGIFKAWLGMVIWQKGEYQSAREYLEKALENGRRDNESLVVGYACMWLSWTYCDLGLFERGVSCGEDALIITKEFKNDHYLYFKSLAGVAANFHFMGDANKCITIGKNLVEYGQKHSDIRAKTLGYTSEGLGYIAAGDFPAAIEAMKCADKVSVDTFYSKYSQFLLAYAYVMGEYFSEAEPICSSLSSFCAQNGSIGLKDSLDLIKGLIMINRGNISKGMTLFKDQLQRQKDKNRKGYIPAILYLQARIYMEIIKGEKTISPTTVMKNIGFIIQNVPQAERKAIALYKQAIAAAEEIGAVGIAAQAHADLGKLHQIKKRPKLANDHFEKAILIFEKTGAYTFLEHTRRDLATLSKATVRKDPAACD